MATKHSSNSTKPTKNHAEETSDAIVLPTRKKRSAARKVGYVALGSLALFALTTVSLRMAYSNRLYPGVWGHGMYLGGLTPDQASTALAKETEVYMKSPLLIATNTKTTTIPLSDLGVNYDNTGLSKELMRQGREGSTVNQVVSQWALLLGLANKDNAKLTYDESVLAKSAIAINGEVATPSINARYEAKDGSISFIDGQSGTRLNFGALGLAVYNHLANQSEELVRTETAQVNPSVDNATLESNKTLAQTYISSPLQLSYSGKTWQVEPTTTLGWLHSARSPEARVYKPELLTAYYPAPTVEKSLDFDNDKIDSYLTEISKETDRAAVDAQLSVTDNKATVFVASQDGKKLNIAKTRDAILASLKSETGERTVAMTVDTTKPTVNEESINNLGIKELLSEGASYFPGSPPNRLTNVRVGAARFNGVLLKPGEVFSFGELLGPVGPEQGYVPGLIILADHEEKAYGGGLCQVSSTAFRAALLAGLPILQRTNHAFAISYYTAPYGVPGVDATIYYPPVDFKFRNDTDAHILIQTEMVGSTLKFRFYGTKKKEGVIRGPYFVSGSMDYNQPSQTVFYRDVMVDGKVSKTDTFNTYYKSALDFPVAAE